ncbi:MAG: Rne/Rng family ribonuclease [Planctomycetaceae bacterium]|nr:Rne/Rng family ribonuclease [Planctomycetaceae bacterium]
MNQVPLPRDHGSRAPGEPDLHGDSHHELPHDSGDGISPPLDEEPLADGADGSEAAEPAAAAPAKRRRRGRRGRRGGTRHANEDGETAPEGDEDGEAPAFVASSPADGSQDADEVDGESHGEPFDSDAVDAVDVEAPVARKKRRRRSRRGKRVGDGEEVVRESRVDDSDDDVDARDASPEDEPAEDARTDQIEEDGATPEANEVGTGRKKRSRRRRRRTGAGRRADGTEGNDGAASSEHDRDADDEPAAAVAAAPARGGRAAKAQRDEGRGGSRSGSKKRGGRRRKGRGAPEEAPEPEPGAVGIEAIPGEEDDLAELGPPVRQGRSRGARAESDDDAPHQVEVPRDQRILVNAADPEETRVVVVEGTKIVDLQMTVRDKESYVNDIYRGRVVNLETAIGAAFVDFGQGRNGFLHVSDVMEVYGEEKWSLDKLLTARTDPEDWGDGAKADEIEGEEKRDEGKGKRSKQKPRARQRKRYAISDLLQKGQTVAVQITKDAIGDKGPTLTTFISIPGRYLVLMPSLERTGVSRKIEDDKERRRLKRILQSLDIPDGMGVIVRTAGVGRTKADIKRDLDYLIAVWEEFSKKLVLGRNPAPLYQESDVAIRTMRDLFSARTDTVVVDSPSVFEHMRGFTEKLMPEHVDRIVLHEAAKPLFHQHGIEPDFERIFARRVELPSGGSIVIDQTEALVAIDVNSGRTRDEGADFEDIALKTNLEAAPEIARQIRLRDLGGILVLDFIDMMRQSSRKLVERALRDALDTDRARSKVGRISQFGLLELTRQRLGPGLSRLVYDTCPSCKGSGRRRTAQSRAQAVLRRLSSALSQKGFTKIEVLCHHDTVDWLKKRNSAELDELMERGKREIALRGVDEQAEESIFHYLRADGREVRPGGRRKR